MIDLKNKINSMKEDRNIVEKPVFVKFDFSVLNGNTNYIDSMIGENQCCPECGTEKKKHFGTFGDNQFKCFRCGYYTNAFQLACENSENKKEAITKLLLSDVDIHKVSQNVETVNIDKEKVNDFYNTYLNKCKLTNKDYGYLRNRGLTDEEISSRKFISCESLAELKKDIDFSKWIGVPGVFYNYEKNDYDMIIYKGILIPVYQNDLIVGMQVRTSNPELRYVWISSGKKKKGTSSGADYDEIKNASKNTKKAIVTEGIFKSIVIDKNFEYDYIFSVQGIGNNKDLIVHINNLYASGKIESVDFAFDMDVTLDVEHQGHKVIDKFKNNLTYSIPKRTIIWDEAYKGIDDLPDVSKITVR